MVRHLTTYIRFKCSPSSEEESRPSKLSHNYLTIYALCDVSSIDLIWNLVTDSKTNILLVIEGLRIESRWVVVLRVCLLGVKVVVRD